MVIDGPNLGPMPFGGQGRWSRSNGVDDGGRCPSDRFLVHTDQPVDALQSADAPDDGGRGIAVVGLGSANPAGATAGTTNIDYRCVATYGEPTVEGLYTDTVREHERAKPWMQGW